MLFFSLVLGLSSSFLVSFLDLFLFFVPTSYEEVQLSLRHLPYATWRVAEVST
jgi:hypothetical protein